VELLQFIVSVSLWGSQDSLNIVCIGTAAFTTARDWLHYEDKLFLSGNQGEQQ